MLKTLLAITMSLGLLLSPAAAGGPTQLWARYKERFLSGDGRVIDHFQHANSHSEGQGYGLLLSVLHRDRDTFDRILAWTEANLQVRRDALSAWSWGKRHSGEWKIIDYNNATDGDLLIALALLKAHDLWREDAYRRKAVAIIEDIRKELAWEKNGYLLLAPAYYGFGNGGDLVVNTGYMVFPAFERFAASTDTRFWRRIHKDSLRLLEKSRFSRFQLPADWIIFRDGSTAVDADRSPYFGYEAIRIPLYLSMAGADSHQRIFSAYLTFVEKLGYVPNRIDLVEGTLSAERAPAGFHAVFSRCALALGHRKLAEHLDRKAADIIGNEPKDYFSNTLYLLSKATF